MVKNYKLPNVTIATAMELIKQIEDHCGKEKIDVFIFVLAGELSLTYDDGVDDSVVDKMVTDWMANVGNC